MFLLSLNKTGLWTMLVLLLLGLSLYPACGRPSFQEEDEDTVPDEDHEEEEEDQVDVQNEDEDLENDPTTTIDPIMAACIEEAKKKEAEAKKWAEHAKACYDAAIAAQRKRQGGGGGGAAGGGTTADEYDD